MIETCLRMPGVSALVSCAGQTSHGLHYDAAPKCLVCGRCLSYVGKWVYEDSGEPSMLKTSAA